MLLYYLRNSKVQICLKIQKYTDWNVSQTTKMYRAIWLNLYKLILFNSCENYPSFVSTCVWRCPRHSSTALSMTLWSMPRQLFSKQSHCAASVRQRYASVTDNLAAGWHPIFCSSLPDWSRGNSVAIDQVQWKTVVCVWRHTAPRARCVNALSKFRPNYTKCLLFQKILNRI